MIQEEKEMKDFCFLEPKFNPETGKLTVHKKLLVKNDDNILIMGYDLTEMGMEDVNSYDDLCNYFHSVYEFGYLEGDEAAGNACGPVLGGIDFDDNHNIIYRED